MLTSPTTAARLSDPALIVSSARKASSACAPRPRVGATHGPAQHLGLRSSRFNPRPRVRGDLLGVALGCWLMAFQSTPPPREGRRDRPQGKRAADLCTLPWLCARSRLMVLWIPGSAPVHNGDYQIAGWAVTKYPRSPSGERWLCRQVFSWAPHVEIPLRRFASRL
jgi:hypothetical protein